MSKLKEASENIKRLAVVFKGLIEASEEIDKLDSLSNHVSELESKKQKMFSEIAALDEQKAAAAEYVSAAEKYGKDLIEQANKESAEINVKALEQAEQLIDKAKTDAMVAKSRVVSDYEVVCDKLAAAKIELAEIINRHADERMKLNEVEAKLAEIRGSI